MRLIVVESRGVRWYVRLTPHAQIEFTQGRHFATRFSEPAARRLADSSAMLNALCATFAQGGNVEVTG